MRLASIFHFLASPIAAIILMTTAVTASAKDQTAYDLAKEGNRYVGEQSKDKVIQIRSEKSVGSTTPNVWYVVYRDETATLKSVEVKFGAGKMMSVKRPFRLLEMASKHAELDAKKLKIDSDKALAIALKEPILENMKIVASALTLEPDSDGSPTWKVSLWAAKLKNSKDVKIGEIWLAAEDGKVGKIDIHPNRID